MRKPKLERVTGVVALSYLVLIPVGSFVLWQKLRVLDKDLTTVWENLGLQTDSASTTTIKVPKLRELFKK